MYDRDLAYIHDTGFSAYLLGAAPGLLDALARHGVAGGLVVDLGCGGGRWARILNRRGYHVLGVDASPDFVQLARAHAPRSTFVAADLWTFRLPECDAVTAIGEVLNYGRRRSLARRVWAAGEDWAVLSETAGSGDRLRLSKPSKPPGSTPACSRASATSACPAGFTVSWPGKERPNPVTVLRNKFPFP